MKNIVIIGGGAAAFECAAAIRKEDVQSGITIYSKESVLPYRRPGLSALAADDKEIPETFFIKKEAYYTDNNINIHLGIPVDKILPEEHLIELADGTTAKYDKLVIATGADARRIPVDGADGKNTFVLRSYQDLLALRQAVGNGKKRCVVIGGGLLGLELADSLLKRNCHVAVIEGADRLLPRNLDVQGSGFAMKQLAEIPDFELLTGRSVKAITENSVVLADGAVECDFVFFSTGSVAVYPGCPQLAVDRGIIVDKHMQTNLPDIFAAGDCAQFEGSVCGLYTTAAAMGKIAGACAAGAAAEYLPTSYPARLNALGLKLFSAGVFDESLENKIEQSGTSYRRIFYRKDGSIAGVVLIGDISEANSLLKQMNS